MDEGCKIHPDAQQITICAVCHEDQERLQGSTSGARYVVSCGNTFEGMIFYGPFDDGEEAGKWAEHNARNEEWHVVVLNQPEEDELEPRYDPDPPSINEQAQRSYYDKYYGH